MIALALRLLLDARLASYLAALLVGRPELGATLEAVCERESHCLAVGVHQADAGRSSSVWRSAVRAGYLDPQCQPLVGPPAHDHSFALDRQRVTDHARRVRRDRAWSTRGARGTMAGYTVRWLWPCADPRWLDVPLVGAQAAARRMTSVRCRQVLGCRQWAG